MSTTKMVDLPYEQRCHILRFLPIQQRLQYYLRSSGWRETMDLCPDILLSQSAPTVAWSELLPISLDLNTAVVDARNASPTAEKLSMLLPKAKKIVLILDDPYGDVYRNLVKRLGSSKVYVFLFHAGKTSYGVDEYLWAVLDKGIYASEIVLPCKDDYPHEIVQILPSGNENTLCRGGKDRAWDLALSVVSPYFYRFAYNAELGLLDPTKPPGPDNPRLKDVLSMFSTMVVNADTAAAIVCISISIDKIRGNTRNRDLMLDVFRGTLAGWPKIARELFSDNTSTYSWLTETSDIKKRPFSIKDVTQIGEFVDLEMAILLRGPTSNTFERAAEDARDVEICEEILYFLPRGVYLEDGNIYHCNQH